MRQRRILFWRSRLNRIIPRGVNKSPSISAPPGIPKKVSPQRRPMFRNRPDIDCLHRRRRICCKFSHPGSLSPYQAFRFRKFPSLSPHLVNPYFNATRCDRREVVRMGPPLAFVLTGLCMACFQIKSLSSRYRNVKFLVSRYRYYKFMAPTYTLWGI